MKRKFALFLLWIFGWKLKGEFPRDIKKSIIAFAPHTSYFDGFIGKIFFWALGVPHKLLMKAAYFNCITRPFLNFFGFMPIGGVPGHNAITETAAMIKGAETLNVLICPEGTLAPRKTWNPGYLLMAMKAKVPIVLGYLDYEKKEGGIFEVIDANLVGRKYVESRIRELYKKSMAKYPEKFELPE